jgi:hypothetical protein
MIEGFLLGVIVTGSLVAALFFLKFWVQTGDLLFLTFAIAFLIEGLNRITFLFLDSPNEGASSIYIVRLLAFLLILGGIVYKNTRSRA